MSYNLYIPSPLWAVSSLLPVALDGVQARGFPLGADGKAAGKDFLAEAFVNVLPDFILEAFGVEAASLNGGEPYDVLSGFQRFNLHVVHVLLDFVLDGLYHGGGFRLQGFIFFQGFDLADDFNSAHYVSPFIPASV